MGRQHHSERRSTLQPTTHKDVRLEVNALSVTAKSGEDRKVLLRPLHLEIHASEPVALMGESGAGKTTLLNALSGRRGRRVPVVARTAARDRGRSRRVAGARSAARSRGRFLSTASR